MPNATQQIPSQANRAAPELLNVANSKAVCRQGTTDSDRDLLAPVWAAIRKHEAARLARMMADAVQECIDQGRADPRNPLVCVLPVAQLSREARDVPQRFRDRAAEHLAVRPDARV